MAGERLGLNYEAFLFHAVSVAARSSRQPVQWNPNVPSLMVQPDLLVGTLDDPEVIVMITRSAARRGWDKKFWRNVGEIVDIRSRFPHAAVVSVALGTEVKEELVEVLGLLVDQNIFPKRELRESVEQWVATFSVSATSDRGLLVDEMASALKLAPTKGRRT